MINSKNEMSYSTYLNLDICLSAQTPLGNLIDEENHFIITHQSIELWFKLIISELNKLNQLIANFDWAAADCSAKKILAFVNCILLQIKNLNLLSPRAFHSFRGFLGSASGLQSIQFREIELISGLRNEEYIKHLYSFNDERLNKVMGGILNQNSVSESLHISICAQVENGLMGLFENSEINMPVLNVVESLLDFDQLWLKFRLEHLMLVERMIGKIPLGTAGKESSYLSKSLTYKFFDFIWEFKSSYTKVYSERIAKGSTEKHFSPKIKETM